MRAASRKNGSDIKTSEMESCLIFSHVLFARIVRHTARKFTSRFELMNLLELVSIDFNLFCYRHVKTAFDGLTN